MYIYLFPYHPAKLPKLPALGLFLTGSCFSKASTNNESSSAFRFIDAARLLRLLSFLLSVFPVHVITSFSSTFFAFSSSSLSSSSLSLRFFCHSFKSAKILRGIIRQRDQHISVSC